MFIFINTDETGVLFSVCTPTILKLLMVLSLSSNHKMRAEFAHLYFRLLFLFSFFSFGKKVQLF